MLTFFGGEPLLNIPVMYTIAERAWKATQARGVELFINIITNGLLLSEEVVDRMVPLGLNGIKITLDGDHDTQIVCVRYAAARAPSTGSSPTSAGWPAAAGLPSAATSTRARWRASRPAAVPEGSRLRGQAREGQLQADRPRRGQDTAQERNPPDAGERERETAQRHVHDVGRLGRRRRVRQL